MIFKTHQIQISCFSRHFYEVNLILVLPQIHQMNFDERKILFIFYDTIFKAMTFSVCSEADQNISDRLLPPNQSPHRMGVTGLPYRALCGHITLIWGENGLK